MAKRVLVFTNHFAPESFKINEAVDWLTESGFEVHVVTGWPNYPTGKIYKGYGLFKKSYEKKGNLTIRRLPLIPRGRATKIRLTVNYLSYFLSSLMYTLFLIFFIKKYQKVIVHHTSPFLIAIPAVLYKKARGAKAYLWDLDLWPQTLEAVGIIKSDFWINLIEKGVAKLYKNFETIFIGSNSFKEIALKRVTHDNIFYFPNWAEKIIEENSLLSNLQIDFESKALKIMYTGNLGTAQDFKTLCNVIIQNKNKKIQWIFVGEGRFKVKMEKLLFKQIKEEKVIFIPQQKLENIPTLVDKADFLYLSLNDSKLFTLTVPAKLQAYMAMGKPILAMIEGEGASIIEEAKCGFYSPPGDVIALNELIKKGFNTSSEERKKLGNLGKDFYKKYYSSEIRKKQLIEQLEF
ncbi:glycosyltransferase family 4 protein [Flavobacteriaceae bacterium]|nr:glycosyltransferase family 4 protein [Flavobacteriaceae bacterium]